jgi:hypothetical protein
MNVVAAPRGFSSLVARRTEELNGCVVIQLGFVPETEELRTERFFEDVSKRTLVMAEP